MSFTFAPSPTSVFDPAAELSDEFDGLSELFAPVIAGARARGVADAFELMGLAVVLIDATGRVLHAGGRAHRALNPWVRITEGHLVGCDAATNDALQQLIEGAVGHEPSSTPEPSTKLYDAEGRIRLVIRAMRFADDGPNGPQLLRSVLVIDETAL